MDGSRKLQFQEGELITNKSDLDHYAMRCSMNKSLNNLNIVEFSSCYMVQNQTLKKHPTPVVVKTIPIYSSNPNGNNFPTYCKYQLLKFKPWINNPADAWDNADEETDLLINYWQNFLNSNNGKAKVPTWDRELGNLEHYYSNQALNETNLEISTFDKEEWMYLSELKTSSKENKNFQDSNLLMEMGFHGSEYTPEQKKGMVFWIENSKISNGSQNTVNSTSIFDINTCNSAQLPAYSLVKPHHENNVTHPLRMIISGQGGSGKSYVINGLREVLKNLCILASFFGIAAFSIKGVTLHSLSKLPIGRRKNLI